MKKFLLSPALLCCLLLAFSPALLLGQSVLNRWGDVSRQDLEATSYTFAPDAEAVVMVDAGEWAPYDYENGKARLVHFTRIKVLSQEGLRYAEQRIGFRKDEKVAGLRAQLHFLDEKGKPKKIILPLATLPDSTLGPDSLCKVIRFPDLKVGNVLEFRYSLVTTSGDVLRPWYFQREIPTMHSEVKLLYFGELAFRTQTAPTEFVSSARYQWVRRYLPAVPADPLVPNIHDHRIHIHFQLLPYERLSEEEEWKDISYALELGTVMAVDEKVIDALGSLSYSLTRNALTEEEKVAAIYQHVQRYLDWNGTYSEAVSQDPGAVYLARTGNSADLNMLLFLLLEGAGLKPTRVFVSTTAHGQPMEAPFWDQFNHLIVKVVADGQAFLLDAAGSPLDYHWLPLAAANGKGWEIGEETLRWIPLPPSPGSFANHQLRLTLDQEGRLSGQVDETYFGYPAIPWHQTMDVSGFQLSAADPFDIASQDQGLSPYSLSFPAKEIVLPGPAGDRLSFPLDPFDWRNTLPIVSEGRTLPVHLGFPLQETVQMTVKLPPGWALPADNARKGSIGKLDLEFSWTVAQQGDSLLITWVWDRARHEFESFEAEDLQALAEAIRQELSGSVTLVRSEGRAEE